VTTRTAGFNTIPIEALSPFTLTLMIYFMFVGASPGSTGGGIKTSTFAILVLTIKNILKGREQFEVFQRTIPYNSVIKAIAILVSALLLVLSIFMILLLIENKPFLPLLFETVSAFGTVGLSMGITPQLTSAGKLWIILLMYLGRIGPLTMVFGLYREVCKSQIQHPEAKVLIG